MYVRHDSPSSAAESHATAAERRAREADTLVADAREGDPRAFDALVRRFRPRIYALALHLCGSASDADDIAQEAFVQAYKHIGAFEGRSAFFTWLYRITVNRALNVERKRGRQRAVFVDDVRVEVALRVDAEGDPRRALELRETYAILLRALDSLSPALKSAVVLTTLQGLSYEEAAVVLNTSEGAMAVRMHEARKQLKKSLDASYLRKAQALKKNADEGRETSALNLDLALALAGLL